MKKNIIKHIVLTVAFSIFFQSPITAFFDTLNSIAHYAKTLDEDTPKDNNDWLHPDYTSYYQKNEPGLFSSTLQFLHLKKGPFWQPSEFKKLLDSTIKRRESLGYLDQFYLKMTPEPETRYIIWESLHGAFHSLIRDLEELKAQGVINDDLKIIKPNYFFIFNGNVIDGSAFILETLTLVLRLMAQNPDNVIYIKGDHENQEKWHNYGLKKELEIRAKSVSTEKIPLDSTLKEFFNTLPTALYLMSNSEDSITAVRISHYSSTEIPALNAENYAGILQAGQDRTIESFKLGFKKPSKTHLEVKAVIKGEDRSVKYDLTDGLKITESDNGATTWTILSSPTPTFRAVFDFFFDAFVIITTKAKIDDWTIALYNRDVRNNTTNFTKKKELGLVSGQPIINEKGLAQAASGTRQATQLQAQPPTSNANIKDLKDELKKTKAALEQAKKALSAPAPEKPKAEVKKPGKETKKAAAVKAVKTEEEGPAETGDIKIACIVDLTKTLAVESQQQVATFNLRFNEENKNGGINGRKIKFIVEDHKYEPDLALKVAQKVIEDYKTDIVIGFLGTATLNNVLPLLKENKLLMLFPIASTHNPDIKNLIYLRASYDDETCALLDYAVKQLEHKKIAIFYQNDDYGINERNIARKKLKELGITDFIESSYERNTINVTEAANKIKAFDPTAILGLGVNSASIALMNSLNITTLANTIYLGNSDMSNEFINFMNEKGLQYALSQIVPDPFASNLQIALEYRELMKRNNLADQISFFSFESYIGADFLIYVLKQIKGYITKEKIVTFIENVNNLDYKGLKLHFSPQSRTLLRSIWIKPSGSNVWKEQKI